MTKRKSPEEHRPGGRPSLYTPQIVDSICSRLSEGEPLAQICREDWMPSYSTVYAWQQSMPDVSEAIARARDHGEDVIASNLRNIARGTSPEATKDVQRDKLIIETDLKLLAKWNPKKWGDRQHIDMDASVVTRTLTDEQLESRITDLIGKAGASPIARGEEPED